MPARQYISRIKSGELRTYEYIETVAATLETTVEWLLNGSGKAPSYWRAEDENRARPPMKIEPGLGDLDQVGVVSAGDGNIGEGGDYEETTVPFPLKPTWTVVQVRGMSAYPVCYPGQFVIIDTNRGLNPENASPEVMDDLHNNIVMVQVDEKDAVGVSVRRAYLKRFCREPRAPDGYVLASIDGGRSSPYIALCDIHIILAVVGVVFEDPRRPRIKGFNSARVNVESYV